MAITSLALDESKAGIYAEAGVPEYWLVRPEQRVVDVYREPTSDGYLFRRTLREHDRLECASLPGAAFRVVDILPARS